MANWWEEAPKVDDAPQRTGAEWWADAPLASQLTASQPPAADFRSVTGGMGPASLADGLASADEPTLAERNREFVDNTTFLGRLGDNIRRGWIGLRSNIAAGPRMSLIEQGGEAATTGDVTLGTDPLGMPIYASQAYTPRQARGVADAYQELGEAAGADLAQRLAPMQAEMAGIRQRPATEALLGADTFREGLAALLADPAGVIGDIGVPSTVQMAPALAASAVVRRPAFTAGSMGATSAINEFGAGVIGYLSDQGVDVSDPEALQAALADPELVAAAANEARVRSGVIGSVDAVSGGLAGRTLVPQALARNAATREAINVLGAQPVVQAAMGAGGEAAAQFATRGEIQPGEVLAEALGEFFMAPAEVGPFAAQRMYDAATGRGGTAAPDAARPEASATEAEAAPQPAPAPADPPAPDADDLASLLLRNVPDTQPDTPAPTIDAERIAAALGLPEPAAEAATPSAPAPPPPASTDTAGGPSGPAQSLTPAAPPRADAAMQNRDRSRPASVAQMQDIRRNPDPARLGFSRDANTGAPMVQRGQEVPAADLGRTDSVVMPDGRRVAVQYAVVDADAVQASHFADGQVNPAYDGAPLQALNNGRTAGLQAAWQSGNADAYRQGLADDAALHGVAPEAIASKRQPILVRLYDPAENLTGAESNAAQQLGLSPVEQAQTDAASLPDLSGLTWSEDGSIPVNGNAEFFRAWFRNMGDTAAATLQDAQGRPNAAAVQRLRSAMIGRAYGDERLLAAIAEDVNPDNRNILNALAQAATSFATLEQSDPLAVEVRGALVGGLELVREAANQGQRLEALLEQGDLLGRNEQAVAVARYMDANKRSAARMAEAFRAMAEYTDNAQRQAANLDVFGGPPPATVGGALDAAGIETDAGSVAEDAAGRYAGGEPAGSGRAAAGDARVGEQRDGYRTGQPGLFAEPTAREEVDAERRRRDAERDGRTGSGRTDMAAGPGDLFAGRRPEQATIPDEPGRRFNVAGSDRGQFEFVSHERRTRPEHRVDANGNEYTAHVADWDRAETSAGSGRKIIEIYWMRDRRTGQVHPFGIETAPQAAGKTRARFEQDAGAKADEIIADLSSVAHSLLPRLRPSSPDFRRVYEIANRTRAVKSADPAELARTLLDAADRTGLQPQNITEQRSFDAVREVAGRRPEQGRIPDRVEEGRDQTQTPEFRRWFGDSKVVDANGDPLVVYHGSPDARFMDADATFMSLNDRYGRQEGVGAFWFAADRRTADSYADDRRAFDYQNAEPRVIAAYLKLENPLIVDGRGREWREAQAIGKTTDVIEKAQAEGHDGVIIRNVRDHYNNTPRTAPTDTYVVFNSRQIKSATDNRGTFDPGDPSIIREEGDSYANSPMRVEQTAFHGSPYTFDRFSTDHIGSGEGNQAFGWGLYFASRQEVADYYREQLGGATVDGTVPDQMRLGGSESSMLAMFQNRLAAGLDVERAREQTAQWAKSNAHISRNRDASQIDSFVRRLDVGRGRTYRVDIPEDSDLLAWDLPLDQQPEAVQKALMPLLSVTREDVHAAMEGRGRFASLGATTLAAIERGDIRTGAELYEAMARGDRADDAQAASEMLLELGIPGLRYLDGGSRADGDGSYNYVIWDDSQIQNLPERVESQRDMFITTRGDRAQADDRGSQDQQPGRDGGVQLDTYRRGEGARPDFSAELAGRAANAIDEIVRRAGGTVLADTLRRDFEANQTARLIGLRAETEQDFATIAQVYRNPLFETLHYVFVDDAGKVLGETAISDRLPAAASAFPGDIGDSAEAPVRWLKSIMPPGTTGLWMVHNHPSGDPTPSGADRSVTSALNNLLRAHGGPRLRGHVVLNHQTYGRLAPDGSVRPNANVPGAPAADPLRQSRGGILDEVINSPSAAASVGRKLADMVDDDSVAVIATGARNNIVVATSIPSDYLNTARGAGFLSMLGTRSGATAITLVGSSAALNPITSQGRNSIIARRNLVRDVVVMGSDGIGNSLAAVGRWDMGYLGEHSGARRRRASRGLQVFEEGDNAGMDEATGLPLNPDGTVTVYHHTSAEKAQAIRDSGRLRAEAEPDVYVTTHAETDTGYGDTAVAIRVDPARLELDDEFPSGRRDFRMNVGRPGGSLAITIDEGAARVESPQSQYTPEQQEFMKKAGVGRDTRGTLKKAQDWLAGKVPDARKDELIQGALNKYYGLHQAVRATPGISIENDPYIATRQINVASTMEAILRFGAPKLVDGALRVDRTIPGLFEALKPVHDNLPGFFGWMVARRAQLLKQQGRENLMSDADIRAGLSLRAGNEAAFDQAARDYLRMKNAILDFAEQHGGTIDPAARAAWDHAEYIPFYRDDGEGGVAGPGTRRGLSHQSSGIRQLKGGEQALRDPLQNIIQNFTRLMDSALKNRALLLSVDQLGAPYFRKAPMKVSAATIPLDQVKRHLQAQGVDQATIDAMPAAAIKGVGRMLAIEAPTGDNVVRVLRNGKPEYYEVLDPLVLRSVTALNEKPMPTWFKPAIWTKNLLTAGATSTPDFLLRNLFRDTGEAWATSKERFIPLVDTLRGAAESARMNELAQDLMMAGSYFHGGLFHQGDLEATARATRRALRKHGISSSQAERIARSLLNPKRWWDVYRAGIEASEMGSRVRLARNRLQAGGTFLEAAHEAKDFLDFQLRGDARLLQYMVNSLPFLNARLQGNYRVGRMATAANRRRAVIGRMASMALASAALYAWNMLAHRDEYEKLQDWEKDAYWHIGPGTDHHIRIPKPFELGLIAGTSVERSMAALVYHFTDGESGDRAGATLDAAWRGILETLALNPTPQIVKPSVEVYFNENTFTGRPIESRSDEFLPPAERRTPHTSDTLVAASRGMQAVMGEGLTLSPKQLQHLWRGYFGGMGMYILDAADVVTRQLEGAPPKPAMRWRDVPGIGAIYRGSSPDSSSRWVDEMYDLREQAMQRSQSIKRAVEAGDAGRARRLQEEHGWLLGATQPTKGARGGFMHSGMRDLNKATDALAQLRKADLAIYENREMTRKEKRERLDANARKRDEIAKKVVREFNERRRKAGR